MSRPSDAYLLEEFLLAALDRPDLLLEFDMVGNRLDKEIEARRTLCFDYPVWFDVFQHSDPPTLAEKALSYLKKEADADVGQLRAVITRVGAEKGWPEAVETAHRNPVPFDEPTLGIVGMWRMGAGANPHFSLAMGEIMLRTGQRHIAWTAYERAYRLQEHSWPDPKIQESFGAHCRARQALIEASLPGEDWNAARTKFEKELAFGQKYQKDYLAHEAKQVAAGVSIEDPHFSDAFHAAHGPIATPVGKEDVATMRTMDPSARWSVFLAGLLACGAAALVWAVGRRRA